MTKDKRWPNEPCGTSLSQCHWSQSEHEAYFNAHSRSDIPKGCRCQNCSLKANMKYRICPKCDGDGFIGGK